MGSEETMAPQCMYPEEKLMADLERFKVELEDLWQCAMAMNNIQEAQGIERCQVGLDNLLTAYQNWKNS